MKRDRHDRRARLDPRALHRPETGRREQLRQGIYGHDKLWITSPAPTSPPSPPPRSTTTGTSAQPPPSATETRSHRRRQGRAPDVDGLADAGGQPTFHQRGRSAVSVSSRSYSGEVSRRSNNTTTMRLRRTTATPVGSRSHRRLQQRQRRKQRVVRPHQPAIGPLRSVSHWSPAGSMTSSAVPSVVAYRAAGRLPSSRGDRRFAVTNGLFASAVISQFISWPRTTRRGDPHPEQRLPLRMETKQSPCAPPMPLIHLARWLQSRRR
jgi:hypothetical protein